MSNTDKPARRATLLRDGGEGDSGSRALTSAGTDGPERFTPGPWHLCAHLEIPPVDCPCGYRGGIWSGDGQFIICEMGGDAGGEGIGPPAPRVERDEELRNAQLIVAAPDLYAALKAIKTYGELACVDAGSRWTGGKKPATKDVWQFPRHLLTEIDEAIAKALNHPSPSRSEDPYLPPQTSGEEA